MPLVAVVAVEFVPSMMQSFDQEGPEWPQLKWVEPGRRLEHAHKSLPKSHYASRNRTDCYRDPSIHRQTHLQMLISTRSESRSKGIAPHTDATLRHNRYSNSPTTLSIGAGATPPRNCLPSHRKTGRQTSADSMSTDRNRPFAKREKPSRHPYIALAESQFWSNQSTEVEPIFSLMKRALAGVRTRNRSHAVPCFSVSVTMRVVARTPPNRPNFQWRQKRIGRVYHHKVDPKSCWTIHLGLFGPKLFVVVIGFRVSQPLLLTRRRRISPPTVDCALIQQLPTTPLASAFRDESMHIIKCIYLRNQGLLAYWALSAELEAPSEGHRQRLEELKLKTWNLYRCKELVKPILMIRQSIIQVEWLGLEVSICGDQRRGPSNLADDQTSGHFLAARIIFSSSDKYDRAGNVETIPTVPNTPCFFKYFFYSLSISSSNRSYLTPQAHFNASLIVNR